MGWDLTVSSKHKLFDFKLRELLKRRDLIYMFFWRDFITTYKQTILGPLWYIINPLCSAFIYAFAFGTVVGIGTDGIPMLLFYFGGTMLWNFFSTCLNSASGIFLANSYIFGKVYFPRLSMPIATTMSATFRLAVQFVVLMFFLAYYIMTGNPVRPTLWALLFPLIVIWIGLLGTGIGMICSALTTKYRDLNHVVVLALQLAMYVTPIVYPLSQVPEKFRSLFYINPLSAPVELFRVWFYGAGSVTNEMIYISVASTVLVVFIGLVLFNKTERTFMDVI